MTVAGELLCRSQFTSIEVWQEKRIVGCLSTLRRRRRFHESLIHLTENSRLWQNFADP
jgi:hypothetical protein